MGSKSFSQNTKDARVGLEEEEPSESPSWTRETGEVWKRRGIEEDDGAGFLRDGMRDVCLKARQLNRLIVAAIREIRF